MTNELIHDVEESLKQERIHALWKEYGPYLLSGVALAILFTALISGWRSWQYKVNSGHTATLVEAMSGDDIPANLSKVEKTLAPGQQAVAYLSHAGILLNQNKTDEALAVLKEAAANPDLPDPYGDLIQLQTVRLQWGKEHDKQAASAMLDSLKPLLDKPDSPWHWQARLQAALIYGQDMQDYTQANTQLAAIGAGQDVPPSLAGKARALSSLYALKETLEAPPVPAAAGTEPNKEPEG
jgi:predicted negative regulator of RcsB-dependent stress response